jgi:putative ABC transport system permease protein
MAVRASLGAARGRLIRQLLTESTLLALAGGALGILVARWAVPALLSLAPLGRIPRLDSIVVDNSVLAFAVGISLVTGVVFGLAPALRLTRGRFAGSLLPGGRVPQAGGPERLRSMLVVAEIALALVLLTGAGLLLKSFLRLRAVDTGFRPQNVVTVTVNLPRAKYGAVERIRAFHSDLLTRLSDLPGVVAAGAVNYRPLGEMLMRGDFTIEGAAGEADFIADKVVVSPHYFQALGIQLLRGRDFTGADHERAARVAIVSRAVARAIAPGEDAVGRRVSVQSRPTEQDWLTIVGVVDDVRQWGPTRGTHPAIYRPYLQVDQASALTHMTFAVRTAADPAAAVPSIRSVLRSVDRDQPASSIALMDDVIGAVTAASAFQARLLGTFAMLAVALALVGTYGVLAYSVSLRTHEIGVRMALGARSEDVLWMVIRRTLMLGATGIGLGILGGLAATRLLATLLFEVTPTDPATFVAVALTILTAALSAGFIPARRAAHVDPLEALRHE